MNQYERMQFSSGTKLLTTGQARRSLMKTNWYNRNAKTVGEKESVLPKNPCSTLSMRFNLCDYTNLSNLANPLFFITVFLFFFCYLFCISVFGFVFPFWVLWFCFEFCVSVLGFVILFGVLCFCFGFCDSVLSFVFLYWVLWFCFEFCVSVLGFVILFCSVSATVRFNMIVTCCLVIL